jgi:hypothetical protein
VAVRALGLPKKDILARLKRSRSLMRLIEFGSPGSLLRIGITTNTI